MDYPLIQYVSLAVCFVWSFLTLVGFFKGKAFDPICKLNKLDRDPSLKSFDRNTIATYDSHLFWFVPISYSPLRFWIATAFNIFFIILFLLLGLGVIYFK